MSLVVQHEAVAPHSWRCDLLSYTAECVESWLSRPSTLPASCVGTKGRWAWVGKVQLFAGVGGFYSEHWLPGQLAWRQHVATSLRHGL